METHLARHTILVVDDDPDILDYASDVLEEYGYAVLTAAAGAAALVILADHPDVMPGLHGAEVARRACQQRPGLKVLFTSGYAADFVPAGRLLKKPYRPHQLTQEIAVILHARRNDRQSHSQK